jgi:hypothetical protein
MEENARLADRSAIHDTLMRYFRGLDRADWDEVRSCFHDDARLDYGDYFQGDRDGLIDYLRSPSGVAAYARTMHFVGNELVEFGEEEGVARTETYCIAHHEPLPGHEWEGSFVVFWVRYLDRFELRDGHWRSASRRFVVEWMRRDTGGGWQELPPQMRGRRDRSDALYAFR